MPTSLYSYTDSAALNTTIAGISIAEGMDPSNVNNAIRALMAHLADFLDDLASPAGTGSEGLIGPGALSGGTISGNLTVLGTLSVSAATVLKSTLNVEGAASISGAVVVKGAATFEDAVTISGAAVLVGGADLGAPISMSGNAVVDPNLQSIGEDQNEMVSLTAAGGLVTMNLAANSMFSMTPSSATVSLTLTNPARGRKALLQIEGASVTTQFPAGWKWVGGSAPTLATTAGTFDIIQLYCFTASSSAVIATYVGKAE